MQDFIPALTALTALLPGVDRDEFWALDSRLDSAERDLNEVIEEATKARDALRNARRATTEEHASVFLGEAFSVAMNPGASGTAAAKIESANANLAEVRTTVRLLSRYATQEA